MERHFCSGAMAAGNSKSSRDLELERMIRSLEKTFASRGFSVRREKLCSGPAFKVKSGNCFFSGENLIFVDRRLPSDQQLNVLLDHLVSLRQTGRGIDLSSEELEHLPAPLREMLEHRNYL